jgi:cytochrome c peroxidase
MPGRGAPSPDVDQIGHQQRLECAGVVTSPLDVSYLPVITLQNKTTGAIRTTTDPGRALITVLWKDVGRLKGPILRRLPSRAPYFHNGSARSLSDVIDFYNTRFNIGFTAQEKSDLTAFLSTLSGRPAV